MLNARWATDDSLLDVIGYEKVCENTHFCYNFIGIILEKNFAGVFTLVKTILDHKTRVLKLNIS